MATVGDNCIDRYLPPIDRSLVGGNALNVAANLRRHGHAVRYAGAVGDDPEGRAVLAAVRGLGIDADAVQTVVEGTGVTLVRLHPDGEREFVSEQLGSSERYVPPPDTVTLLAASGWVHCAGVSDGAGWLAELSGSTRVSYDFSHPHDAGRLAAVCPHLTVAFLSLPGGSPDEGMALARRAVALGALQAVVTLGRRGSAGAGGAGEVRRPALDVVAVDTLGAGDAYIAGTVDALLGGADLDQAMAAGTADAAEACLHLGAWPENEPIRFEEDEP